MSHDPAVGGKCTASRRILLSHGCRVDDRRVISGILFVIRNTATRRRAPYRTRLKGFLEAMIGRP